MENQTLATYQQTVIFVDKNYIPVKPMCDFFGIDYDHVIKNIKRDPILPFQTAKKTCETLFGDKRPRICLSKKGFLRWIQVLNVHSVKPELRDSLIEYQRSIFDYFYGDQQANIKAIIEYRKLKELNYEYGRIGREIQTVKNQLYTDLDNTFIQQSINFHHQD